MQRVALLGLGTMGAGMAANWLAKGFRLYGLESNPRQGAGACGKGRQSRGDAARSGRGRRLRLRDGGGRRGLARCLARRRWRARRSEDGRGRRRIEHADARLGARARRPRSRQGMRLPRRAGRRQPSGGGVRRAQALCRRRRCDARQGAACAYRNRKQDRLARTGGRRGDLEAHQQPAHRRPDRRSGRSARCGAEGRFPAGADLQSHPQRRRVEPDREDETAEHA